MLFVKNIAQGHNQKESAILSGYGSKNADVVSSRLMRNEKIVKALERRGMTDDYLAEKLKDNIDKGSGIKANADTALRAIEMVAKMKGHMNVSNEDPKSLIQNNYYIELQNMNENELDDRIKSILTEVKSLQSM